MNTGYFVHKNIRVFTSCENCFNSGNLYKLLMSNNFREQEHINCSQCMCCCCWPTRGVFRAIPVEVLLAFSRFVYNKEWTNQC